MRGGKTVLCEVGCGPLSMCYGALLWNRPDIHVLLVEPHPEYAAAIRSAAAGRPNVEVFQCAIGDEPGSLDLLDEGTSSSLVGVASPALQHKGEHVTKRHKVQVARMSAIDPGDVDILRVDVEGHEWAVLKHLVSRPQQIVVEVYNDLGTYVNPHLLEIMDWADLRGYRLAQVADSDFVYQLAGPAKSSALPIVGPARVAPPLPTLEEAIKRQAIASFVQGGLNSFPPDHLVTTLHQVFTRKQKTFEALARWAAGQIARGHEPDRVVNALSFYGPVLADFASRNLGQPLKRA